MKGQVGGRVELTSPNYDSSYICTHSLTSHDALKRPNTPYESENKHNCIIVDLFLVFLHNVYGFVFTRNINIKRKKKDVKATPFIYLI